MILLDASKFLQVFLSVHLNYTHLNNIIMLVASIELAGECEFRDLTASSPREVLAVLLGVQM